VRTVLAGLLLAITASQVSAADVRTVVHVADHASVPRKDCEEAQRVVQRVFRTAGVVVDFVTKPRRAAANDAHHVELVIFSDAMVALEMQSGHVTRQVVGRASRPLGRAYVYYKHVAAHARDTRSSLPLVLAMAIAHEVAHLHLPPDSHSSGGIMEARVGGRITRVPTFTGAQAAAMRGFLAAVERSGTGRLAQTQPAPADATTASSEDLVVMKVIADPFAD
jgi:hypothetical protein